MSDNHSIHRAQGGRALRTITFAPDFKLQDRLRYFIRETPLRHSSSSTIGKAILGKHRTVARSKMDDSRRRELKPLEAGYDRIGRKKLLNYLPPF